jgi:hypothetical protein
MKGTLTSIRNAALEARAATLYSPRLPYHNFEHIEETLAAAVVITGRCAAENIRINNEVVYYALLFHDAGYHEDHRALGFDTKEAYSATLAEKVLVEFAIVEPQIRKTVGAIRATERDASFISVEQKAVRAADLSGMAAPYEEFLLKSLKLKREFEIIYGNSLEWRAWQETSREVLSFYLSQEIRLTSYFHNEFGESGFHSALRENLRRLLAEAVEPQRAV